MLTGQAHHELKDALEQARAHMQHSRRLQRKLDGTAAEVTRLLVRLAAICDEHETCVVCGAAACGSCAVGPPFDTCATGAPLDVHCVDCTDDCGPCQDESVQERRAEAAADIERFGYY